MNKTLEKEEVINNVKKPLKTLYKGVKLPVFKTLLGSLLYMVGTVVVATQADNLSKIQIGSFSDLSPVFTYALMCMIGYVFFYISVVADLAFVDLAGNVRKKIWKKVMNLPLSYYDREGANKVISRVTSDPEYSYMPFKLFQLFFTLLVFLLLVLVGDAAITELALILMGGFVVTMVIMFASAKFSEKGAVYVAGKLADFTAFLAERFNRIRFIKAMNSEEKETDLAVTYINERYEAEKYNAIATTAVQFGQMFLTLVLQMAAFLFGGILISQGKVDSTTRLVAFYGYGSNLVLVFQFFAQFPSVFAATRGGSKKIVSIFMEDEENLDEGRDIVNTGDLAMDHVTFGYAGEKVVKDVSLIIPKGKVTAIIGPNGSGKTTVLRLLDRLYPDYEGNICIGAENSKDISLRNWRNRFAVVSQKASLFEGTIRDNITYGLENVSEEEIMSVVKLACLDDVIASHQGGLQFNVGVNGEKLSGGEQQRVAIARAMIKNADYLVLDESTANLDPITEKKVRDSIETLKKGRTVIVVAHNYSAIANADKIIVMNEGVVEDEGTPYELLGKNSFYTLFREE
ncbi:MAG: ABC transporter ATP-binding protein [Erysipelotrichaceae bacterium]|nr:ABC transporter ATP-binding protein [Erysipelotrichaceae bacterium]